MFGLGPRLATVTGGYGNDDEFGFLAVDLLQPGIRIGSRNVILEPFIEEN